MLWSSPPAVTASQLFSDLGQLTVQPETAARIVIDEKNGTIVIDGGKSETGAVNGTMLPGVPVTVRVEPKGFTVEEPPSAATGWKRIAIHSQKKAHIVVTVFWDVKPQ